MIAGQGAIAMEVLRQIQSTGDRLDAVFVAIGGGGLISGATGLAMRWPVRW